MTGVASLFGDLVYDKSGNAVNLKNYCTGKVVGIFFSDHVSEACRIFTPKLVEFYKRHHVDKHFEIIFMSSDQTEDIFKGYYAGMPWLFFSYNSKKVILYFELFLFRNAYYCLNQRKKKFLKKNLNSRKSLRLF